MCETLIYLLDPDLCDGYGIGSDVWTVLVACDYSDCSCCGAALCLLLFCCLCFNRRHSGMNENHFVSKESWFQYYQMTYQLFFSCHYLLLFVRLILAYKSSCASQLHKFHRFP